jgi:hypothetical protein
VTAALPGSSSLQVRHERCTSTCGNAQGCIHRGPYLFRRDDTTQTDFIAPASGATESFDIVVRLTHLSEGIYRGVTRECISLPLGEIWRVHHANISNQSALALSTSGRKTILAMRVPCRGPETLAIVGFTDAKFISKYEQYYRPIVQTQGVCSDGAIRPIRKQYSSDMPICN